MTRNSVKALLLAVFLLLSLSLLRDTTPPEAGSQSAFRQTGVASYYGAAFRNRKTASGERFDPDKLTAAHRSLPLGSNVRVKNLKNGKEVTVKINDRGPYKRGRILDLTTAGAKRLGFKDSGIAKVEIVHERAL